MWERKIDGGNDRECCGGRETVREVKVERDLNRIKRYGRGQLG